MCYHMRSGSTAAPGYNILSSAASHINNEPFYFVSSRSVVWNFACFLKFLKKVSLHVTSKYPHCRQSHFQSLTLCQ